MDVLSAFTLNSPKCVYHLAYTGYKMLNRLTIDQKSTRKSKFGVWLLFQKNKTFLFEKREIQSLVAGVATHTVCLRSINLPNISISLCHEVKYLI